MTVQAHLEITDRCPLRGTVRIDGADPVPFEGWVELKAQLAGLPPALESALSEQELRVASLAAEGLSNAAIGAVLSISDRTVQWHLNKAFKKTGVRSRTELAARLIRDNEESV